MRPFASLPRPGPVARGLALYIRSWSDFVRRDQDGNIILDSLKVDSLATPPTVLWTAPLPPYTLENVGQNEIWVISVELKKGNA